MKASCFFLTSTVVFLILTSIVPAQLSPESQVTGTLDSKSTAFFLGRTLLSGSLPGYPMDSFIDSTLSKDMTAFPLIERNSLNNVKRVYVINTQDFSFETINDVLFTNQTRYSMFSHVNIVIETGFFLFGIHSGNITFQSDCDYAITGIFNLEIIQDSPSLYYIVICSNPLEIHCTGQQFVLFDFSEHGFLQIEDASTGEILWKNNTSNTVFVIEDTSFFLIQESPLHLYSLYSKQNTSLVSFSVTPADTQDINSSQLMAEIRSSFSFLGEMEFTNFTSVFPGFDLVVETALTMMNGAMVVVGNTTMIVDETPQSIENVFVSRNSKLNGSIEGAHEPKTLITGNSKMIFLGNYLYNPQAKQSTDGVAFPYEILVLWIISLIVYILIHVFYKPQINQNRDSMIRWYALAFHISMLIITFVLVDREISYLFGMSALDALFHQGVSFVLATFLGIQLLIWMLGFIILAMPIRLLMQSGLHLLGIGKGGNGISKGVGAFFIWIFSAVYIYLIVNVVLLFLPDFIFPLG